MIDWKHAIPGYGFKALYDSITSDDPFAIKVRDAAIAGATLGFHTLFGTATALSRMDHQIATRGYYAGRTHGWGAIRHMIKASPAIAAITLQAAAGHHIAEGGTEGHDLYTAPQRRRVEETGVSGINLHYRSI